MEESFNSPAVKAKVLDRVGREARWYRYRLPILIGIVVIVRAIRKEQRYLDHLKSMEVPSV